MGYCHLPHLHVWELRLEEIFRSFVPRRASDRIHGDLVGVYQQVIPWP